MDHLQTRLEALEHHMHAVNRRLRWWRGLAGGLLVLAVLTWALPLSTAQEGARRGEKVLAQRVAALENLLKHFSREGNEVFITGANLHIVNGLGQTVCPPKEGFPSCNGLGNLIMGYNELRDLSGCQPGPDQPFCANERTGSHNVVVGQEHNFSRFGGLVVGQSNDISGDWAVVSGGIANRASNSGASVSGGLGNAATGALSSVCGGGNNTASGPQATVSGGELHTASGEGSAVSGGVRNVASGLLSSISGGSDNIASGGFSSVSGGVNEPLREGIDNTASGENSSVSGGSGNRASGNWSVVGGGLNRTAAGDFDWVAGSLVEDE
jgi:trimeric autotransporter adhesin